MYALWDSASTRYREERVKCDNLLGVCDSRHKTQKCLGLLCHYISNFLEHYRYHKADKTPDPTDVLTTLLDPLLSSRCAPVLTKLARFLSGPTATGVREAEDATSHALRNSTESEPQNSPGHWATAGLFRLTISIRWHFLLCTDKHLPMICRTVLKNSTEKPAAGLAPFAVCRRLALPHHALPSATSHTMPRGAWCGLRAPEGTALNLLYHNPQAFDSRSVLDHTLGYPGQVLYVVWASQSLPPGHRDTII